MRREKDTLDLPNVSLFFCRKPLLGKRRLFLALFDVLQESLHLGDY